MSLHEQLERQIQGRNEGVRSITVEQDPRRLTCNFLSITPLACEFQTLRLQSDELASATIEQLTQISEDLAGRLTYLLESLGPVEIDRDQCVVQMRSVPPAKSDDGSTYYELLVRRGGSLNLCRYGKQPGQPRQVIPATLTQEVLVRLVGDFEAALG